MRLDVELHQQAFEGQGVALLVGLPDGEEAVDVAVVAGGAGQQRLDAETRHHRLDAVRVGKGGDQPGPDGVAVAHGIVDGVEG